MKKTLTATAIALALSWGFLIPLQTKETHALTTWTAVRVSVTYATQWNCWGTPKVWPWTNFCWGPLTPVCTYELFGITWSEPC